MPRPARILIACTRCKTRKTKCDGATPKCSHCVAKDVECVYAAARQYRGKGRETKAAEDVPVVDLTEDTPPEPQNEGIPVAVVSAAVQAFQPFQSLQQQLTYDSSIPNTSQPSLFPSFLLPGAYESHLAQVKSAVDAHHARQTSAPLVPLKIVWRLLQNAYADVRQTCPFLEPLEDLLSLLDAQYEQDKKHNTSGDAKDSAGSALVNAVVALAIRQKMAVGAELHISGIAMAYYCNATLLLHGLLLEPRTRHTVPALRAMAAFAQGTPDTHAAAMLLMNAEAIEGGRGSDSAQV
ncbi:hypothetical protein SCUCBS95973_008756 [Sporothrix curviconia]|uniref:Zn(2)-C6 fungal-type domain-containing protein n=1 Tax=Sporothrix curviconia TaxID=1260050 RepID=A0ABP0CRD8_9PEZI